jgi:hypothetical protein
MLSLSPPDWDFDPSVSRITGQLYLSDYLTARNSQKLQELGITHIVSLLEHSPTIPDCIPSEKKLHVAIDDLPEVNILQHLPTTTAFITAALQEGRENKVLVWELFTLKPYPIDFQTGPLQNGNKSQSDCDLRLSRRHDKHVCHGIRQACPGHTHHSLSELRIPSTARTV